MMEKSLKKRAKELAKNKKYGSIYAEVPEKKGKKGKNKNVLSNRAIYDITLSNFQFFLYTTIETINGIDTDVYVYADSSVTVLNGNMKINKAFKNASKLDWDSPVNIDSLTFRGRFATLLLLKLVHNSHSIVKGLFNTVDEKIDHKYGAYWEILNEFIGEISIFVTSYLSADLSYALHLQKIYEILLMSQGKDTEIIDRLSSVREMLEEVANGNHKYDDGTICNNVMKMAYVLATDSLKLKDTPKYDEDLDFKDYYGVGNQIGTLGYAIMRRRMKIERTPFFYSIFEKAKPRLTTRFVEVEEMPELAIGVKSLTLLEIFLGDVSCTRYIDKLIK